MINMDKYLSFSDNSRMAIRTAPNEPPAGLIRWVSELPSPIEYFTGQSFQRPGLPDNILLFARLSADPLASTASHHHHRYVLIICLSGSGTVILNQHPLRLEPGTAVLVHPLQFHHYTDVSKEDICWLFLTFEMAVTEDVSSWRNQIVSIDSRVYTLLHELSVLWNNPQGTQAERREIPLLLGWLVIHLTNLAQGQHHSPAPRLGMEVFFRVEKWLSQNPVFNWSIPLLAQGLGMSERHLRRCFLAETHVGIGRFLQERRMLKSITVLRRDGRVSDAAEAGGYSSLYVFSRAFRRMFGRSPRDYRHHR
jgi:AraC-like DNA-binding protein/quercetin dioxygenase-like cupin family protein